MTNEELKDIIIKMQQRISDLEEDNKNYFAAHKLLLTRVDSLCKAKDVKELQEKVNKSDEDVNPVAVSETENTTWPEDGSKYWIVCANGRASEQEWSNDSLDNGAKDFGNCFYSKEEAELAIQKLRAFKRLRDNGLKIYGYNWGEILFDFDGEKQEEIEKDLDLLFSGDE